MSLSGKFRLVAIATLSIYVGACDQDSQEPSTTRKALDDLQQKYDELVDGKLERPVQWATDDLENIGDWEYEIVEIPNADSESESLLETLNEYGDERWEVFWIDTENGNLRIMLKRPSRSYLSRIPLSQIGRFVIGSREPGE